MTPKSHVQERLMHEGKLLYSELISNGETLYVERVGFKDWHVSLHNFYLISDRLCTGVSIIEQKWNYEDFCDIIIRLEDHTFLLTRQVEEIVLVRSYRPIPIEEFERIARPLLYRHNTRGTSIIKRITSIWTYLTKR